MQQASARPASLGADAAPLDAPLLDAPSLEATALARARAENPSAALAVADLAAWARAEGPDSVAGVVAMARRDVERWVPGLPARATYKVLGLMVAGAVAFDIALGLLPLSPDFAATTDDLQLVVAGLGTLAAFWSILSEMRGWDGSDASTWFAKRRIDRTRKRLAARRAELAGTALAIGESDLVVYRDTGPVRREAIPVEALRSLRLEPDTGTGTATLVAVTRQGERRFDWLACDPQVEAAVAALSVRCGAGAPARPADGAPPSQ